MKSSRIFILRFLAFLFASVLLNVALMHPANGAIRLDPVLQGFSSPLYITNAHDDSNRLFIVEQGGRIKVLAPGATTPTVFLDVSSKVLSGGERGLLGLAFHPQFGTDSRFFVYYTRQEDGAIVIAEYQVSAADPNVAAATETVLLTIAHPSQANHNGGMIELASTAISMSERATAAPPMTPQNNAQNINVLLGKILRIDVDHSAGGAAVLLASEQSFFRRNAGCRSDFRGGNAQSIPLFL